MAADQTDIKEYISKLEMSLDEFNDNINDSWDDMRSYIKDSMRRARVKMQRVLKKYPPSSRESNRSNMALRKNLESIYTDWAVNVQNKLSLPRTGSSNGTFKENITDRAALSLDTSRMLTKSSDRTIKSIFEESARKVTSIFSDFQNKYYPGEVLSSDELAERMAEYIGVEDKSYVENVARNLADGVSRHANEMGDTIRNPRPDDSPEEAVESFDIGDGGKVNERYIKASHDAHAKAFIRNTLIDAVGDKPPDTNMGVYDADKGSWVVMDLKSVRENLAGNQAKAGPFSVKYPVYLPREVLDYIQGD